MIFTTQFLVPLMSVLGTAAISLLVDFSIFMQIKIIHAAATKRSIHVTYRIFDKTKMVLIIFYLIPINVMIDTRDRSLDIFWWVFVSIFILYGIYVTVKFYIESAKATPN